MQKIYLVYFWHKINIFSSVSNHNTLIEFNHVILIEIKKIKFYYALTKNKTGFLRQHCMRKVTSNVILIRFNYAIVDQYYLPIPNNNFI